MADGVYQIRVVASDPSGGAVKAKLKTTGRITSVSLSEKGQDLGFNGLETLDLKDVISVFKPTKIKEETP